MTINIFKFTQQKENLLVHYSMKLLKHIYFRVLIFGVASMVLAGCFAYTAQKKYTKALYEAPYDAIIVPGVPLENGMWSSTMKARVYWSVYLFKKGIAKNIIFSGSAVYTPYVEAKVMALYAEQLGVPNENIFTEPKAEHSTENLFYSYKLSQNLGFNNVALTSDPFQSKVLEKYAYKYDLPVDFLPVVFSILDSIPKIDPDIDEAKAFVENFVSIEERESSWKRFAGTRGKNIRFDLYNADTIPAKQ